MGVAVEPLPSRMSTAQPCAVGAIGAMLDDAVVAYGPKKGSVGLHIAGARPAKVVAVAPTAGDGLAVAANGIAGPWPGVGLHPAVPLHLLVVAAAQAAGVGLALTVGDFAHRTSVPVGYDNSG